MTNIFEYTRFEWLPSRAEREIWENPRASATRKVAHISKPANSGRTIIELFIKY
jgi:hypothetical protein